MVKKFLKKLADNTLEALKERIGTIVFLVILGILLIVGSLRIKQARSNAITFSNDYEAPEATANLLGDGEYRSIAKNDKLELLYNDVKGAIQIKNLESGYVWKSIVDSDVYAKLKNSNKQWQANMQSAIHIKYNDLKKRDSGVKEVYCAKDCGFLESNYIENGVEVTYGFLTPGIYITVQYTIEGGELVVRIPYEKIREDYKFAVTTISVLPYLGACGNDLDGYLFYPDGSGAITTFAKVGDRGTNIKGATYYTYTNKTITYNAMHVTDNYNKYTISMPVCGIKHGTEAVFGYATEGAANTAINVYPSGIVIDLNRQSFDVFVRNIYNVDMYSISSARDTKVTGGMVQRVDKRLIPENKEIRYSFLSGDKANYSGMADCYRNYLISKNELKSDGKANNNQLALRLLCGTKKEGIVFDEYISMTSFERVREILEKLKAEGIDMQVVLSSWQKNSEDNEVWGPDSRLGGTSGFKALSDYARNTDGLSIYAENSLIWAYNETSQFDEKKDSAYNGLNMAVTAEFPNGDIIYLRNPNAILKTNASFLNKISKYDGFGIAYGELGKYAYADFNEWHSFTKNETVDKLKEVLSQAGSNGRNVAVNGSNQYVFANTDYLYNIKEQNYGFSASDYSVPFIQLVISGLISYSSENAGNLSYDLQTQKLHWIECGSMPYFYLTYESALKLRDTGNDELFSSTFSDWEPVVVETYKEFKENFSAIAGDRMVEHTVLSEYVRRIRYENGTVIYVNYSAKDASADGINIPAKGYVVTGGR